MYSHSYVHELCSQRTDVSTEEVEHAPCHNYYIATAEHKRLVPILNVSAFLFWKWPTVIASAHREYLCLAFQLRLVLCIHNYTHSPDASYLGIPTIIRGGQKRLYLGEGSRFIQNVGRGWSFCIFVASRLRGVTPLSLSVHSWIDSIHPLTIVLARFLQLVVQIMF